MTSKISDGDYGAILRSRERKIVLIAVAAVLAILTFAATPALAETTGPQWTVSAVSHPTNFKPGGDTEGDQYVILVTNTGGGIAGCTRAYWESEPADSKGNRTTVCPEDSPVVNSVTITDQLPEGLTANLAGVSAVDQLASNDTPQYPNPYITGEDANFSSDCLASGEGGVSCTYGGLVQPGDTLVIKVPVLVAKEPVELPDSCKEAGLPAGALSCVGNVVRVSGGGAPAPASIETPTLISGRPAGFGVAAGGATNALSSVQAGAHPDLTVSIAWNTTNGSGATAGNAKNTRYVLPAGFAGDLVDTPVCQASQFLDEVCPAPTQVGDTTITLHVGDNAEALKLEPVYNLAPEPGDVAKLGFNVGEFFIEADVSVRPGGGGPGEYGLQTTFYNLNASSDTELDNDIITIWGVPASPLHNPLRFSHNTNGGENGHFGESTAAVEAPYFTNPTACTSQELNADFSLTSWQNPLESENPTVTELSLGRIVGCDRLAIEPKLTAEATTDRADAATGLVLNVNVPQTYDNAAGLATSTLEKQVVTLPEGMTVNPSAGAGLAACSLARYAQEGAQYIPGQGCPNESKLGEVEIVTPSLSEHVKGSVFLAEPAPRGEAGKNPFNSLLALYIVARIPDRGVLVKAPGEVHADPVTGRLVTTFDTSSAEHPGGGLPPLPFSLLTFKFNPGETAPLVTPPTCGSYEVTTELTPWSDPEGTPVTPLIPPFPIDTNCPAGGVPPFHPSVTSYPVHGNAGAYSPLYLQISRNDGEQEITGFATAFPPGLTGNLSGVAECSEAQVQHAREQTGVEAETSPACPANSEIGYSIAEAGVGGTLAQNPGKIYLGGPYDNAPFSVVSVTAAHVGPFDLGTVVIHFPLDINPETADVTIPASPSDVIPHILKGIVVHVRDIRVYVNRANFMLNPTSCAPQTLSATVIGGGANPTNPAGYDPVTVNDPFQTADCEALKFEPKLAVSTSGKTSKANGASLTYKLTYPTNALGNDANIKYVKVTLPKALPSRLTTLQRACLAKEFQANPASCPPESAIGHAHAVVPNLPVPLEGPVYFVSHGGEAFPSLEVVLQGDGVTVILVGATYISPQGVTSTTFHAVPDNPVTSFEITLPEGKFSALGTNKNLCDLTTTKTTKKRVKVKVSEKLHGKTVKVTKTVTRKTTKSVAEPLVMGNEYIAQNGATYNANTALTVTGCPKAAKAAKKAKKGKGHKKGKRKK